MAKIHIHRHTHAIDCVPVSLPLSAGSTSVTALAAPVDAGMMFWYAARASRMPLRMRPSAVVVEEDERARKRES